jgi:uncharacterized protein YcfL
MWIMRLFRSFAHTLMILGLAMGAGACEDRVRAPGQPRPDPIAGAYPKQVTLEGLEEALVTGEPVVQRSSDDQPMRVNVPIRSVADKQLRVQYRFIFLDEQQRPLDSNSGWKFQVIEPRTQVSLEGRALETSAADWRLEIRPAR